jgi:RNA polymerase sigma factor (sigma-70 family)
MMANRHFTELIHRLRAVLVCNKEDMRADAILLKQYVNDRDQDAFTVLVARHCQAVWGVCLGFFRDSPDAEDVFQATFLRLARKADTIRCDGNSIRGWLCRVASRTAQDLRRANSRRAKLKQRLSQDAPREAAELVPDRSKVWDLVVEELAQLPNHYREPLEHSLLRGQSSREAASELGCSHVAIQHRIERGQQILRERLQKRGVALTAGSTTLAAVTVAQPASAMPSLDLLTRTAESALAYGAGHAVSGNAAALAGGAGLAANGKLLVLAAVLICGTAGGVVWAMLPGPSANKPAPIASFAARPTVERPADRDPLDASENDRAIVVAGRVLDADGKHVSNANVVVLGRRVFQPGDYGVRDDVVGRTNTDAEGRFSVQMPGSMRYGALKVWAAAPGLTPVAIEHHARIDARPPEIQLRQPETIRGIVRDFTGKALPGATVSVNQIGAIRLETIQGFANPEYLPSWPESVTTREDGSFELHGLNLNAFVGVQVNDDRHALQSISLNKNLWSGQVGSIQMRPARYLEGRILAADTRQPLPRVRLNVVCLDAADHQIATTVDALADDKGAYRVRPNWGEHYRVTAVAPDDAPYLAVTLTINCPKGEDQKLVDIELPRGVLMKGRVTDHVTGKPLSNVRTQFFSDRSNAAAGMETVFQRSSATDGDGRFQIVAQNVSGNLVFQERSGDYVIEQIASDSDALLPKHRIAGNRVIRIEPGATIEDREFNVALRRGVRIDGYVVGPNGRPVLEGMWMSQGLSPPQDALPGCPQRFRGGQFTLRGCEPGRVYPVLFLDGKNNIGARVDLQDPVDGKALRVKLQHCGEATARVLDELGEPCSHFAPNMWIMAPCDYVADANEIELANRADEAHRLAGFDVWNYRLGNGPATDDHGFVVFPGLIPGVRYRLVDPSNSGGKMVEFEVSTGQSLTLPEIFK